MRKIVLLAAALLAGVLCMGIGGGLDGAAAQEAPPDTLTGTFDLVWGDKRPQPNARPKTVYTLTGDRGGSTELLLDRSDTASLGGPQALSGEKVEVAATEAPGDAVEVQDLRLVRTRSAAAEQSGADISGARPAVTVLCRFGDSTGATPKERGYFEGLMGSARPGLDNFWREVSYNNINLSGSRVVGWFNLPQPRSYYLQADGDVDFERAAQGCAGAADAEVNFPAYTNVNLMFNQDIGCCAWGGSHTLSFDGVTKSYGTTWMPPWAYADQFVLAHELGHSYGLPHSSGAYADQTYDSDWDPMSDGSACAPPDAVYGCVGVHTIAYHKDLLGWIPPSRIHTPIKDSTVTLERVGTPATGNYLMAKIPINGSSTRFYTVESRRFTGYDAPGNLPAEAVVIHKVDTTLSDRNAQVVDPDNNGDPNDAAARWLPGETFTDAANKISVKVQSATATGYSVSIGVADTTAPTGKVLINNGARKTRVATVTLALSATDDTGVTGMRFSRDGNTWTAWEPYAPSKTWKLPRKRGTKTVYAQFTDAAGNISARASDTIFKTR